MTYAIVEAGGKQIWMELGKFYDLNYIPGNPGDVINLNRVLFLYKQNIFQIGKPCLTSNFVKTKILKHIKGRKLTVFKIKPKKNYRRKQGHRQKLTRILVENII
uniref:50S ribosomal protein L21, chloroplastic n=1 Tax=Cumathamnion serrulatum TaxID=1206573 RepID=A0A7U1AR71_9FLOR|nr:ribosomal protein L21 [Cumathamnion serrulatum]QQY85378.1 ribosomal protein L21 [Cumathamnion serrulatum]